LASLARSNCHQNYRPRSCRDGWVRLSDSQCVKYFALSKTFTQAESFCAGQGGHLASVHNSAENHHVFCLSLRSSKKSPTTNDHFWIGGSGKTSTSGYRWTDGSTFGFAKWFYGSPQHRSGHNCVVVNHGSE
ncbi:echinoidin-like, partial [Plectropomus leopardus]|uniref:echinoidin-like n=1 Tax=Plectropomus leopardus TaxID=160734 RepID=UPI001C4C5FA6